MFDIFDISPPECEETWDGPYQCFDDFSADVEGLESCEYWYVSTCIGEERCHAEVTVDGDFWEGSCDDIAEEFGHNQAPPPTCLEFVFESCLDSTGGINGDMSFTECEVYKYYDTCIEEEKYCWTWFVKDDQEFEGYCHEDFFGETQGDEWCQAQEFGPFECPPSYGMEICEYFMFKDCEGRDTCFVNYLDEDWEWHSSYCNDMPAPDGEQCQVVCTESFECQDSAFETCEMKTCHDTCTGHFECYASWSQNGTNHQGKCADFHDANKCAAEEPKPA